MKHHAKLTLNFLLFITILFLTACGGGGSLSSNSPSNQTDHPKFIRSAVIDSPRYEPSGLITDVLPSFSWKAIPNATQYKFGHENTADETEWHSYIVSAQEASCGTTGICQYTPSDYTFPINVEKVWWLKAFVNDQWQEWSRPIVFTVLENTNPSADAPSPLSPTANIISSTPLFSWALVNNATEYKVGYEDSSTGENWHTQIISVDNANCQSDQTCSSTLSNTNFSIGNQIIWWVKAKTNGVWSDWSEGLNFTVIEETNNSDIPTPIGPSGTINTNSPEFSWTGVAGATDYKLSHEDTSTSENWQEHSFSAQNANCVEGNACTYTLANQSFITGDQKTWWVKAKVNGVWGEWSDGTLFTVEQSQTERPFIFSVKDGSGRPNNHPWEISIKTIGAGYNYNIDCNSDGVLEGTGVTQDFSCQYLTKDIYAVTISGVFPQIRLNNLRDKYLLTNVKQWGSQKWRSMSGAFFRSMVIISATDIPDLSRVTDMSNMFAHTYIHSIPNIENWDVSNVTDMDGLFSRTSFNQDIGNWDVSNVTNMNAMFSTSHFNQDIGSWDISSVTNMVSMFARTHVSNTVGISNWDVSNVTNMGGMFLDGSLETSFRQQLHDAWIQYMSEEKWDNLF